MRRGPLTTLLAGLCLAMIPACAATDDPAGAARKAAHQTGRAITWPFRKLAEHHKAKKEAAEVPISTVSTGATEETPILADGSKAKDKDGSARLASARKDEVRIDSDSDPDDEPAPKPRRKRTPTVETSDADADADSDEAPPPRRKRADPIVDSDAEADSDGDRPARNPSWKSKGGSRSASADRDTIRIE